MVDGTGLENQRAKAPQVRILSLPPNVSGATGKMTKRGFGHFCFMLEANAGDFAVFRGVFEFEAFGGDKGGDKGGGEEGAEAA